MKEGHNSGKLNQMVRKKFLINQFNVSVVLKSYHTTIDDNFNLEKFWLVENVLKKSIATENDNLADKHFQATH